MGRSSSHAAMHLAFWFPVSFSTPLLIVLNNPSDVQASLPLLAVALLALSTGLCFVSYSLVRALGEDWQRRIARVFLAAGLAAVLQANLLHELFYYGEFNGETVDWRRYGWQFWAEFIAFCISLPLAAACLLRVARVPSPVIWLPYLSCLAILLPALAKRAEEPNLWVDQSFDRSVFQFSDRLNLLHLLPDGLQGDIVREVLEEHPALAAKFDDFTLFADHLGLYQGTAPSVPALFNGRPYGLELGHSWKRTMRDIADHAYQNTLSANAFQLDYVSVVSPYCVKQAKSCVVRPFNDLKARGYYGFQNFGRLYSLRLVADLALFRHVPMLLKEVIYDEGNWFLADTTMDGSSPYPDPVIREWVDNLSVVEGPPRYKFYHSIGTHIPAQWDEHCNFVRDLDHSRANVKNQTLCVLTGISRLLAKLERAGIYHQTAIVITGDHGCNIAPNDMRGSNADSELVAGLLGTARPAFLVKRLDASGPLEISHAPTSVLDVAKTALDLVGLADVFEGYSAFDLTSDSQRVRIFRRYSSSEFWNGRAIPFREYAVNGPVNDLGSWQHRRALEAEPQGVRAVGARGPEARTLETRP